MHGRAQAFMAERGFGFIAGEDGRRYFAQRSEVAGGAPLLPGQAVAFTATAAPHGPRARAIQPGPAPTLVYLPPAAWIVARSSAVRGHVLAREIGACAAWGRDLDAVRDRLCDEAARLGANAVLGLERAQRSRGTWFSGYRWTEHTLAGRAVVLVRPVYTTDAALIARWRPLAPGEAA